MKHTTVDRLKKFLLFAVCAGVLISYSSFMCARFVHPFPSLTTLPHNEVYLTDIGSIMLGARRIGADLAWVHLMHYYARDPMTDQRKLEIEYSSFIHKKGERLGGDDNSYQPFTRKDEGYEKLYEKALRVVELDPMFYYAYIYASGALAWNLKRYDQAYALLNKGLKNNPTYWRFAVYISAILFKEKGDIASMIKTLEGVIAYPDCPNLIKSIVANYYKRSGQYVKSIDLWIEIYESDDESYMRRALDQIQAIKEFSGIQ